MFTPFQKWCLCLGLPSWNLPPLTAPSQDELTARAQTLSFDLCEQSDRAMAQLMVEVGHLSYLEEDLCRKTK